MSQKIIAQNKKDLNDLIKKEMDINSQECNLNHIDVSNIEDMSFLFYKSPFNGNISDWNVSNVTNMKDMFNGSQFNGDISNWNVSKVTEMKGLFSISQFNGDISSWDVSNVTEMSYLFYDSRFTGDISSWRSLKINNTTNMFLKCSAPIPYWFGKNNEQIIKKIESCDLFNKMNGELIDSSGNNKKLKI